MTPATDRAPSTARLLGSLRPWPFLDNDSPSGLID
jgi:hypothetical protein